MAHVREELALGPAGLHGLVARDRQVGVDSRQFRGPGFDGALEAFLVLNELDVAAMDLGEHLVEAVDELGDLVFAFAFTLDADVVDAISCAQRA